MTENTAKTKHTSIARIVGMLFVAASLFFVADAIIRHQIWTLDISWGKLGGVIVLGVFVYVLACQILAQAWVRAIHFAGGKALESRVGRQLYAQTNIGKYLPGNVFHFVGRHVRLRGKGISDTTSIAALIIESGFQLSAAILLSLIWLPELTLRYAADMSLVGLSIAAAIVLVIFGVLAAWQYRSQLKSGAGYIFVVKALRQAPQFIVLTSFFYFSYFCLLGVLGAILVDALSASGAPGLSLETSIGAFCLAWAAGYVVLGAPAGIGVREAVLILSLSVVVPVDVATATSLSYRLVTTLGDVMFFAVHLGKEKV